VEETKDKLWARSDKITHNDNMLNCEIGLFLKKIFYLPRSFIPKNRQNTIEISFKWCLMSLSTVIEFYCGGPNYWWRKSLYSEKSQNATSHTKL
jgi:hypothetical protein